MKFNKKSTQIAITFGWYQNFNFLLNQRQQLKCKDNKSLSEEIHFTFI